MDKTDLPMLVMVVFLLVMGLWMAFQFAATENHWIVRDAGPHGIYRIFISR